MFHSGFKCQKGTEPCRAPWALGPELFHDLGACAEGHHQHELHARPETWLKGAIKAPRSLEDQMGRGAANGAGATAGHDLGEKLDGWAYDAF